MPVNSMHCFISEQIAKLPSIMLTGIISFAIAVLAHIIMTPIVITVVIVSMMDSWSSLHAASL